jgi:hypothetical protein
VAIITGYYFLAHQPELESFRPEIPRDAQTSQVPYTPHPVDKFVLDGLHKLKLRICGPKANTAAAAATTSVIEPTERNTRLEKALLKVGSARFLSIIFCH